MRQHIHDRRLLHRRPGRLIAESRFTKEMVRAFLAISWLLFVLALAVGGFARSLLAFYRDQSGSAQDMRRKLEALGLSASSLLQLLITGAFSFLDLTVLAYV
jgi:hypothetical protein